MSRPNARIQQKDAHLIKIHIDYLGIGYMMKLDEVSELDRVLMEGDQIVSSALQRMEYEAAPSNLKKPFEFGELLQRVCDATGAGGSRVRPGLC